MARFGFVCFTLQQLNVLFYTINECKERKCLMEYHLGPFHTLDWRPMTKNAEIIQVHFTLWGEGLKARRKINGWKVYMESYMVGCRWRCMVCQNLCQAHLQEVGLIKFLANHGSETTINSYQAYFNIFKQ